jgi:phosphohistidine swiveling domain-containing protein
LTGGGGWANILPTKNVKGADVKRLQIDDIRHAGPTASPLVEATLSLVHDMVRARYNESGLPWAEFSATAADALITNADFAAVEARILASGHRFDWSAAISVKERPEVHKPVDGAEVEAAGFTHPDAPSGDADARGYALRGVGDNVVRHEQDVIGVARYIRSNDRVLSFLTEGVPPGTIAVIDDSGGTLTAPIIEQFAGVICAGGTVRSHLGILTREYNIPCVMNAKVAGIRDGDRVVIECSAESKTTEDYQQGIDRVARIWLVEEAAQ